MAYFEDLSPYAYSQPSQDSIAVRNVGWLSRDHEFPRQQPSEALLDALWEHCAVLVEEYRGIHECEFCESPPCTYVRHSVRLLLGSAEIRVSGPTGDVFAAPNLIYHYICDHHYAPPAVFLQALEKGPRPGSEEYARLLASLKVPHSRNKPKLEEPRWIVIGRRPGQKGG